MIITNDYDRKQIELMKKTIELYEERLISLGKLVDTLEGLYSASKSLNPQWKSIFFEKWIDLECVFAAAINKKPEKLEEIEIKILKSAISDINNLIDQALNGYKKFYNPAISNTATLIDD